MSLRDLELRVIEAARADHPGGCEAETCGGTSYDPCDLANALASLDRAQIEEFEPVYVSATFLHIRSGDTLRMGEEQAQVKRCHVGQWHAHIETITLSSGKPWDKITPREHVEVWAELELAGDQILAWQQWKPSTPVEIYCATAERHAELLLSLAGLIA